MYEYVFGANILENLTTGMYKDSKVSYREYIQNACGIPVALSSIDIVLLRSSSHISI